MASSANVTLLRASLLVNAVFTALCGLGCVFFSGSVAEVVGAVGSTEILLLGTVLLLYATDLARTGMGHRIPSGRVYYFIGMDVLWVLGSAVVLWGIALPFTTVGRWSILLVADGVGVLAICQFIGLRRMRPQPAEHPLRDEAERI